MWKVIGLVIGTFLSLQASALTTTYYSQDYVPMSFDQSDKNFPAQNEIDRTFAQQKSLLKDKAIQNSNQINNDDSDFSLGKVEEHKLAFEHPLPTFFVVGQDAASMKWLEDNREYLKSLHAIGLFCGKITREELVALEKKNHISLLPANLEQVSKIIGTNHYPVLVYKGWVTQ